MSSQMQRTMHRSSHVATAKSITGIEHVLAAVKNANTATTYCTRVGQQKAKHMSTLRQEVIAELRRFIDDSETHGALDQLPAWFASGDDTVTPNVFADQRLQQIAKYPKRLGSLAYVPTALVSWLRETAKKSKKGVKDNADGALHERCKLFHEQWNAECKRRKEAEEQRAYEL